MRASAHRAVAALAFAAMTACGHGVSGTSNDSSKNVASTPSPSDNADTSTRDSIDAESYEGVDSHGIPHYATSADFSRDDARVLRMAYGIEDPRRLYVSDSTEEGLLKYDTQLKRCATCYVNSYRVGFVSVRRTGESWEEAERRVRGLGVGALHRIHLGRQLHRK